jgi:hypothetical protein
VVYQFNDAIGSNVGKTLIQKQIAAANWMKNLDLSDALLLTSDYGTGSAVAALSKLVAHVRLISIWSSLSCRIKGSRSGITITQCVNVPPRTRLSWLLEK